MSSLRSLTALIIEPQSGMRANLHTMLNLCDITQIDHAVSSGTAIRPLKSQVYDLILCEYDLGNGQDGQQLLEDLRHNKLIPLWTIFIIVTTESSYERVVSAAELAPTDYILKPFTVDTLLDRISRALEKRNAFLPVYHLMEHGHLHEAIEVCQMGESRHRKYAPDFMRLRAELHVILGEAEEAERVYQALLETRAVAWARLGLAKTLFMQKKFGEAEMLLAALVEESSLYMDAYDWLARTREASGKLRQARDTLANAVTISPHAVRRLRKLGDIALEAGDLDTAERSYQKVVFKARHSEFRDPEDHVRLVDVLVRKGDTRQAAGLVRDMERSLAGSGKMPLCKAMANALVHEGNGDRERAAAELGMAVAACRDTVNVSNELKMELARHCLEHKLDEGAAEVMCTVMSNTADEAVMAKAMQVFEQAGRAELAQSVAKASRRQVVALVSDGAERARRGDYAGAVELMTAAVQKLPGNPQVVFNAAVAVLKHLEHLGWDNRLGTQLRSYIETSRRLDPTNPRLASLVAMYHTILKKYGMQPSPFSGEADT